jgi:hypothetical protein
MTRFTHRSTDWTRPAASHSRRETDQFAIWQPLTYAEMHQMAYDDSFEPVPTPSWASAVQWSAIGAAIAGAAYIAARWLFG